MTRNTNRESEVYSAETVTRDEIPYLILAKGRGKGSTLTQEQNVTSAEYAKAAPTKSVSAPVYPADRSRVACSTNASWSVMASIYRLFTFGLDRSGAQLVVPNDKLNLLGGMSNEVSRT